MKRLVCAIGFLTSILLVTPSNAQDQDYMGGFEGRWEGSLKSIAAAAYDPAHGTDLPDLMFAFAVKDETISVYTGNSKGNWSEIKPGRFQILMLKTNATITSVDSSNEAPDKSGWVETWNFSVTHKDRDHLLVVFTRLVNNYALPDENHGTDPGRFIMLRYGEMHRVNS